MTPVKIELFYSKQHYILGSVTDTVFLSVSVGGLLSDLTAPVSVGGKLEMMRVRATDPRPCPKCGKIYRKVVFKQSYNQRYYGDKSCYISKIGRSKV